MPTRFRKVRKRRGSRTYGWGQIGQHRKHGAKGGRGNAGKHKHKWTYVLKYEPDHFGEKGFVPPTRRELREVNLTELSAIAERLSSDPAAPRDEEGRLVVDLRGEVPVKLIGSGVLYVSELRVIADAWTKGAEEKLRAAGSVIAVR